MKSFFLILTALLCCVIVLSAQTGNNQTTSKAGVEIDSVYLPEPTNGLLVEFGLGWRSFNSLYKEEFSTQEITSLQAGKAVVTFEEEDVEVNSPLYKIMLGYKLHDFVFFGEVSWMIKERINAYSYSWADPTLKCNDRWAGPIGCEIAFIAMDPDPLYGIGVGYNIWRDFYIKARGQTQGITIYLGRETYSQENNEVRKDLYYERTYSWSLGLDWFVTKRYYPVRIIVSTKYGQTFGPLTKTDNLYIDFSIGGLFPFSK